MLWYDVMGRWSMLIRARKKKEALSYVHDYISRGQSMHHAGDHCSGTLLFSITLPLYWDIKTMEVQNTERLFSAMRMEDGVMKDSVEQLRYSKSKDTNGKRWEGGTTGWARKPPPSHPPIHPLNCQYFKFQISPPHECIKRWSVEEEKRLTETFLESKTP